MKKNKISSKYKIFITPAILFVVFIFIIVLALNPLINKLEEKSDNVQKKLVESEIEKDKIDELPKIKEKFMKVNESRSELDVLFEEGDIVDLVQEIEKIAENTGNSISISVDEGERLNARKKTTKKGDETESAKLLEEFSEGEYFEMDIEVVGSYNGLLNFIDSFNSLNYYNSLVSFKIESYEKDNEEQERLIDIDVGRANSGSGEEAEVNVSNLALKSKLNIVFYLNKIVSKNKESDKDGS